MFTPNSRNGRPPKDIELAELVPRARGGNDEAWTALVEHFDPLVRAVARGYRLADNDVDDVGQNVWLLLVEHVDRIREPKALPAWLITTARRESLRLIRQQRRATPVDPFVDVPEPESATDDDLDAHLLRLEEARVLQQGLDELPPVQRNLLLLLSSDLMPSYREISAVLMMPVGSIGPTRARGLARLRAIPAVREYLFPADCPACGDRGHARSA
jgi:RNA polymerase sigma factor (sigma-70 family)